MICVNTLLAVSPTDASPLIERVLWMQGNEVVVIDIHNPHALPVWQQVDEIETELDMQQRLVLAADDYAYLHRPDRDIPEKYCRRRDQAWATIEALVQNIPALFDPNQRGGLIAEAERTTGKHRKYLYQYLRHYWQRGQTRNALLPDYDHCGGPGKRRTASSQKKLGRPSRVAKATGLQAGISITPEIEDIFRRAIRRFYQQKRLTLRGTYQRLLETYFNQGFELHDQVLVPIIPSPEARPTFRQFTYWFYQHLDLKATLLAREGERRFNLRHRELTGDTTTLAFGPGAVFQIDAALGDVYLISEFDPRRIIGKPTIYFVMDTFSRLVAGIAVTLDPPSWQGAMLALANTTADKVTLCAEYGIKITEDEWPCHYFPKALLADRGEFEGYNANHLVTAFNLEVANAAPYRADWKFVVERTIRLYNDQAIHLLPAAVQYACERGDRDARLDACLTLRKFQELLLLCTLHYNNEHRLKDYLLDPAMIADGVEPYPVELWQWGIANRTGCLRTLPPETIRLNLFPDGDASVTEHGIAFQGLHYTCSRAFQEQWFLRARNRRRWKLRVAYDPRLCDHVYLRSDNGRLVGICVLLDRDARFQGWAWRDVLDYFEQLKLNQALAEPRERQANALFNAQMDAIVAEAQVEVSSIVNTQSKRARVKGIRANRKVEQTLARQRAAQQIADQPNTPLAVTPSSPPTGYVPPPDRLEELQRWREEARKP